MALIKGLQPKVKLAVAGVAILFVALVFATCSACRKPGGKTDATNPTSSPVPSASTKGAVKEAAANAGVDEPLLWQHGRLGDAENLSHLAGYEGPVGLQETAEKDPALRPIAIKAMAYLQGWAQLPYLVKIAASAAGDPAVTDDEAALARDSILELATRPRTSVDPEDAEELEEGCKGLLAIAKDSGKGKPRRVHAVRVLRMIPCPIKPEEVPSDVDAK